MEKLDKAYEGLELLKSIGMDGSQEQLRQINEMEREYLESEVIPFLKQEIKPLVDKLMNRFSVIIELNPQKEMSISLTDEKQGVNTQNIGLLPKVGASRSSSMGFAVHFPDGEIIKHGDAKTTFLESLKKIGLGNASRFKERTFRGFSLVDRAQRTDCDFTCQEYIDGWYVYVAMSNETKMELLSKVAKMINLPIRIVKDDGSDYTETEFLQTKSSREHFSLNGSEPRNKRRFVLEAVKEFIQNYPTATFANIVEAFPDKLQGSYGVVKPLSWVLEKEQNGFDFKIRYHMDDSEILTSSDGIKFVVCNQWGNQFYRFAEWVQKTLGWNVDSK